MRSDELKKMKQKKVNLKRRKFLKFLAFGSGAFILGGFITRIFGIGEDDSKYALPIRSYKVLEKDDQLIFYNSKGHKLFTVSDDGSLEIS